ncbi:MAG: sugar transferase, partial [Pseudomonadota bacterium]
MVVHCIHRLVIWGVIAGLIGLCVIAAVALLILNPVFNPGPLLFAQRRVGQFEQPIMIWKFRTMAGGDAQGFAPDQQGRTPWLGRVLRHVHIDELPQIWNILTGRMALIGPRPEQWALYPRLAERTPCYRMRTLWRPGLITHARLRHGYAASLAQHRHRAMAEIAEMQHRSAWGDVKLIGQAVVYVGYKIR